MELLLSVLITSHNQGALLERCVNSVLAQSLPFKYEIVISDDNSTDGTWEIAKRLSDSHPQIKAVQCNTDDFSPVNRCQRCGWNQGNAYRVSSGKYYAHIDADDFYIQESEVLKKQVEILEQNPSCACCMANYYLLNDGEDVSNVVLASHDTFQTGEILPAEEYIANHWRSDHSFVFRRYNDEDPTKLFGGYYDDTLITNYHLLFGDIICLEDAGYVYVQYKQSIWHEVTASKDDRLMCPIMYIPYLLPKWAKTYFYSRKHTHQLLVAAKYIYFGHWLQKENYAYLQGLPNKSRLVKLMNHDLTFCEKSKLFLLLIYLLVLKYVPCKPLYWILYIIMK